jgi:parallel beta-helix repeat protein
LKRILRLVATAGAGSLMLLGTALVSPASAAPQPSCGNTVLASVTMTGNLSCSGRNSGIAVAPGVNLNCNGFSILGDPSVVGEGPGITVNKSSTVTNCTVKYFNAGIALKSGGGNNVISNNTVQDNISLGSADFGDGIALDTSSNNQITGNTVNHNGPYDGIGLIGKSNNNLIQFNSVTNNNVVSMTRTGIPTVNQDDGIRIEGPGAMNNRVQFNTVSGSGLEGIAVFGNQGTGINNTGNIIDANTVSGNGNNTLNRQGSGIRLFLTANNTQVTNNTVTGNAANGIEVDSLNNTITGNAATGNSAAGSPPPRSAAAYDLLDTNPTCDANAWHNNTYGTAHPACAGA